MSKRAPQQPNDVPPEGSVRDPLAVPEAVIEARLRLMSERLEQALISNSLAAELRAGMARAKRSEETANGE